MGGDTGKNALGALISTLAGSGAGLITGSRKGAGKDLLNILSGTEFDQNALLDIFGLGKQPEPAQPKAKPQPKHLTGEAFQPLKIEPTGVVEGGPPVASFEQNALTPLSEAEQYNIQNSQFIHSRMMEGVGPDGQPIIGFPPQQWDMAIDPNDPFGDVIRLGDIGEEADGTPTLKPPGKEVTLESVMRPLETMEQMTPNIPELPERLRDATIMSRDTKPELAEDRVAENLTLNNGAVRIGSILDQVPPTPPPEEAVFDTTGRDPFKPPAFDATLGRDPFKPPKETQSIKKGRDPFKTPKMKKVDNSTLRINDDGVTLLEEFEGREKFAYDDGAGNLTIGIGHMFTPEEMESGTVMIGGEEVDWRQGLSDEQIDRLAAQDLQKAAETVRANVKVPLSQNEFNALVSFAFNIGPGAFKGSGAIKALNAGDKDEFMRRHQMWNKAGGSVLDGLVKRRTLEAALFQHGSGE